MKIGFRLLWIPLAMIGLQSCLAVKNFKEPQVVQRNYFRTDSLPPDSLNNMAELSWRKMFTDSLLQSYIATALNNNMDIRVALQQINIAKAYLKEGKAGNIPTLSYNAQYGYNYVSENGSQGGLVNTTGHRGFSQYNLGLNLSWEADIWGKIRSQKRALRASYLQTVAAHKAVMTRLVAEVASTYYSLLALDKQIALTKQTITIRKQSMETTEALKQAGSAGITSVAVEQTKAQYLDAQALLLDLQKQSRVLEDALSVLMGEPPHTITRSKLDDQRIATDLKIGVPTQLLRNRPDVMAAEKNYQRAFEETNVAHTFFYPSFTITAAGGLQSLELTNWFNAESLFGNVLGGLLGPILNHRQIRTNYEVAKSQQEQAKLQLEKALLQAGQDVSDALYSYESASKKVYIMSQEQSLLEQAVNQSQALLKSGYGNFSYLEVLRAQESVLNTSLSLVNARLAQLNSIIDLYEAVGGGWR